VYLFWKKQLQIALNLNVFCRNTEIEMMMKTLVSSMIPSDRPYGGAGLIPDWSTNRERCCPTVKIERYLYVTRIYEEKLRGTFGMTTD
jgi:hypothetical protein